jgi:hypothetical protein
MTTLRLASLSVLALVALAPRAFAEEEKKPPPPPSFALSLSVSDAVATIFRASRGTLSVIPLSLELDFRTGQQVSLALTPEVGLRADGSGAVTFGGTVGLRFFTAPRALEGLWVGPTGTVSWGGGGLNQLGVGGEFGYNLIAGSLLISPGANAGLVTDGSGAEVTYGLRLNLGLAF